MEGSAAAAAAAAACMPSLALCCSHAPHNRLQHRLASGCRGGATLRPSPRREAFKATGHRSRGEGLAQQVRQVLVARPPLHLTGPAAAAACRSCSHTLAAPPRTCRRLCAQVP